jgi:ribonuclease HI
VRIQKASKASQDSFTMTPFSRTTAPGSGRLFSDSQESKPPAGVHIANIDGAARGNPGPASYAVVIRDPSGKIILELAKKLGRDTNNVAEYYALLAALDYATTHGISALRIRSDSELLVRQMQGRYKVKSPDLKPLHERAAKMTKLLSYFAIEHVRREMNSEADALANRALDSGSVLVQDRSAQDRSSKSDDRPVRAEAGSHASQPASQSTGRSTRHSAQRATKTIRARFTKGVLVPADAVDLPEDTEVILELRVPKDRRWKS